MSHIIPKLGLKQLRDDEVSPYAQDKIDKINLAPAFAAVDPSTATVNAKNQQYLAALVKADNGTTSDTALKDQRREELEELLTLQAFDCAAIANGDLPLYLSTGYDAKNTQGQPTGPLPQVTGLELDYGDNAGELKAKWNPIEDADNFTVWVYSDINNPDGSLVKEYIKHKIGRSATTLSGLPSDQKVYARVRANGGSTEFGPWSDLAEKRVP